MIGNPKPIPIEVDYLHNARQVFNNLDVKKSTIADYKYRISLFVDFVAKHGFYQNTFLEFKRYLAAKNDYSVSTKNKYLISAKIFLNELHHHLRTPNLVQNVRMFTQNKHHKVDGINDEEMDVITSKLQQLGKTPRALRLKALITLLALQGLRSVEVVRLNVDDLNLSQGTAMVMGKGSDDKELIYLHPITVQALRQYTKANRISSGALFVSNSNHKGQNRLTTRGLRKILTVFLRSADIEKTVHGFRHYFTSKLIKSYKGDLLEVARYTRHKSLEMLQVYNDNIKIKADLPRYYSTFDAVMSM
jgi:integrase